MIGDVIKMSLIVCVIGGITLSLLFVVYEYANAMGDIWTEEDVRPSYKQYRSKRDCIIYMRSGLYDGHVLLREGRVYELRETVAGTNIMKEYGTGNTIYINREDMERVFEEI